MICYNKNAAEKAVDKVLSALQVVELPYPVCDSFLGMNQAQAGGGTFLKSESSRCLRAKGGCSMTLLETLALLTLIVTVIYGTVDVTLKVIQYIESKQNKKD